MAGIRELYDKNILKKVTVTGRVEGSVLKWDIAKSEYVKVPFGVPSTPSAWDQVGNVLKNWNPPQDDTRSEPELKSSERSVRAQGQGREERGR
jgi:hypothetical protein